MLNQKQWIVVKGIIDVLAPGGITIPTFKEVEASPATIRLMSESEVEVGGVVFKHATLLFGTDRSKAGLASRIEDLRRVIPNYLREHFDMEIEAVRSNDRRYPTIAAKVEAITHIAYEYAEAAKADDA